MIAGCQGAGPPQLQHPGGAVQWQPCTMVELRDDSTTAQHQDHGLPLSVILLTLALVAVVGYAAISLCTRSLARLVRSGNCRHSSLVQDLSEKSWAEWQGRARSFAHEIACSRVAGQPLPLAATLLSHLGAPEREQDSKHHHGGEIIADVLRSDAIDVLCGVGNEECGLLLERCARFLEASNAISQWVELEMAKLTTAAEKEEAVATTVAAAERHAFGSDGVDADAASLSRLSEWSTCDCLPVCSRCGASDLLASRTCSGGRASQRVAGVKRRWQTSMVVGGGSGPSCQQCVWLCESCANEAGIVRDADDGVIALGTPSSGEAALRRHEHEHED